MNVKKINNGGVRFHITREMIRNYRLMSPEARLEWLENACILSFQSLTSKRRSVWEKFRRGEI